jgi:two-component system sensor histidine kinase YesM
VENSFKHGFTGKQKGGRIEINVLTRNHNLTISISDNGCGIPNEQLEQLNMDLSVYKETITGSHIGMLNVNNRIKLFYGHEYGLHMESNIGEGTIVTVQLPYNEV